MPGDHYLVQLKEDWNKLAAKDALWAILSDPKKKNHKWQLEEFFKTGEEEVSNVLKELESLGLKISYKTCLDFGCGIGRLTQPFGKVFQESIGIDISEKMIAFAKDYNHRSNCHFFVSDDKNLSLFPNNHFSFIYSNITFQHIHPSYALVYIRSCLRKLEREGLMIFQITTKYNKKYEYLNFINKFSLLVKGY